MFFLKLDSIKLKDGTINYHGLLLSEIEPNSAFYLDNYNSCVLIYNGEYENYKEIKEISRSEYDNFVELSNIENKSDKQTELDLLKEEDLNNKEAIADLYMQVMMLGGM